MNRIQILDCTLRDGGYVNDWRFGTTSAKRIVDLVSRSGVDYVELGFIRNGQYEEGKIEFTDMAQITNLFRPSLYKLALMVEIGYGYPITLFPNRSQETADLIRLVVWKRLINESYNYAKLLIDKGYEVCIQATRIEQYTDEEFKDFVTLFSHLQLKAIYIVDTFGLLTRDRLLDYASIADDNLSIGTSIGYHAHNNMQQALANMCALLEHQWKHSLMIDASIMGIGRGAGNLCLELLLKHLKDHYNRSYKEDYVYEAADKYIAPIFNQTQWGYSIPYLLSAINGRNPSYVRYLKLKKVSICQMAQLFKLMKERNVGIVYDERMCDDLLNEIQGTQTIS